ncbi:hypothetical protein Q1695_003106 [Nippostrongylus brasiliensis]|nr:hypothetical protein Q1695_003106 [Nippostrongylus brasiliensis]
MLTNLREDVTQPSISERTNRFKSIGISHESSNSAEAAKKPDLHNDDSSAKRSARHRKCSHSMKSQKQPLNDLSSLVELGPLKRKKLFQAVHDSLSKRSDRSKSEKKKGKGSNKGESSWKKKKLLVAMQSDEQSFKKSQKGVEDKGKKERKSKGG